MQLSRKRTACACLLLLLPLILPERSSTQETSEIESPRLRALAAEIAGGNTKALDDFWQEIEAETTPLLEPIEDDPKHVQMTVVWRGDAQTENVLLVGGLVRGHPLDNTLDRLLETDLWYRTYRTGTDLRATYRFSPNDPLRMVPMDDAEAVREQRKNYRHDPLNPKRYGGSLVELVDAPPQPWIEKIPEAPRGEVHIERAFKSEVLGNERRIGVYVPHDYSPAAPAYPLFLVFDYESYSTLVPTPRILDNLIHAGRISPMVAVLVGNAKNARNYELTCNDLFVEFLAEELIPWVWKNYNVSTDSANNVVAGSSFGGLASSFLAFRHPELFGNVISQSGSYWWSPETNSVFLAHEVEGEWLTRQFTQSPAKPIRFFIEVGLNEGGSPSMVIVNRHFRDVLVAKGYEIVHYDEFNGGHEYLNWRGSLANALIALVGNQPKGD